LAPAAVESSAPAAAEELAPTSPKVPTRERILVFKSASVAKGAQTAKATPPTFGEEQEIPIRGRDRPQSPVPTATACPQLRIAIDFHNVLDAPRCNYNGGIPTRNVEGVRALKEAGHTIFITSFGGREKNRSTLHSCRISGLTEILGGDHFVILQPHIAARTGDEGKAQWCVHNRIDLLIDDNDEILLEAEELHVPIIPIEFRYSEYKLGKHRYRRDLVVAIEEILRGQHFPKYLS
jgi:hypothetical protein